MRDKIHTGVAAKELGMTIPGLFKYIVAGHIRTERFGRLHVIDRAEFDVFKGRYFAGEFDGRGNGEGKRWK
jgi:hypothetical protein